MTRLRRTPSFAALVLTVGVVVAGCGNDDPDTAVEASPTVANVGNLPETNAASAAGAAAGPAVVELPGGTLPVDDTDADADAVADTGSATTAEPANTVADIADETASETSAESSDDLSPGSDPCGEPALTASTNPESTWSESSVAASTTPESTPSESSVAASTTPESTSAESTASDCPASTVVETTDAGSDETDADDASAGADGTAAVGTVASTGPESAPGDSDGATGRPDALASARERWEAFASDADADTFVGGADTADLVEGNRVLMIGDSIMASTSSRYGGEACNQLEPEGWAVEVNAETGRFIDFGMRVLDERLDDGFDVAVVMLGNNYGANPDVFEEGLRNIVDELIDNDEDMPIVLYTVTMYRPDRAEVNDIVYDVAAEHDNIRVIDWETETTDDPSLVGGDGLHLSDSGRKRMIELLADELGEAPDGSDGECLDSDFTDDSATSGTGTTLPGQAPYTNPPQNTQPQWTNPPQTTPQTSPPTTTAATPAPTEPVTNPPATNPPATNPPATNPPVTTVAAGNDGGDGEGEG